MAETNKDVNKDKVEDNVKDSVKDNGKSKVVTVSGFVKHYSSLASDATKQKYLSSHIVRKYCPVLMKRAMQEAMVEQSKAATNEGIPYIDMMVSKINFVMAVIALYTDLIVDRDENDRPDSVKAYDVLNESGVQDVIMDQIGEDEIQEMITIQDGQLQSFEQENHSTEAVLMQLVDRFGQTLGIGLGYIQDVMKGKSQEEVLGKIKEFVGGIKAD